ncbi:MAG: Maf family protein [Clostridia bacterium]|nr:Maf family protein [Clostridia bacterium]
MSESIILASSSPRRSELLKGMGIEFRIIVRPVDEHTDLPPRMAVMQLAERKARAVAGELLSGIVIGCDTLVCLEGEALGKPADEDEARNMLKRLSGKTHSVFSGICVIDANVNKTLTGVAETLVEFREMSDREIEDYVATGEPMDKAGAYAIQGGAGKFVKMISGSFENVMGLPVQMLRGMLESV